MPTHRRAVNREGLGRDVAAQHAGPAAPPTTTRNRTSLRGPLGQRPGLATRILEKRGWIPPCWAQNGGNDQSARKPSLGAAPEVCFFWARRSTPCSIG